MRAQPNRSVAVLGTGSYLPPRVLTNDDLRPLVTNYDEAQSGDFSTWVDRVTHIHRRRYIGDGETAATMGAEAARRALDMADVRPTELDLIVHASFTPSAIVPGDHVFVAQSIGAERTPSFALTAACAGSIYGLAMAYGLIASGTMRRILVIGSETISPTIDFGDPLTAILFGDGAGAVVLGAVSGGAGGVLPPYLGFEFNAGNITMNNANLPFTSRVRVPLANGSPPAIEKEYLRMQSGPSVLRSAVNAMAEAVLRVLGLGDLDPDGPEARETLASLRLVPHQANGRIVDGLGKKLGVEERRVTKTIYDVGNISAASNVIALDYAVRHGNLACTRERDTEKILSVSEVRDPIRKGELVVLPSIGAGYLYGAIAFVHGI
ncbi:MAG: 3-oxoacyl-ACP synthase III family protein [Planctomycetota bacterium]